MISLQNWVQWLTGARWERLLWLQEIGLCYISNCWLTPYFCNMLTSRCNICDLTCLHTWLDTSAKYKASEPMLIQYFTVCGCCQSRPDANGQSEQSRLFRRGDLNREYLKQPVCTQCAVRPLNENKDMEICIRTVLSSIFQYLIININNHTLKQTLALLLVAAQH